MEGFCGQVVVLALRFSIPTTILTPIAGKESFVSSLAIPEGWITSALFHQTSTPDIINEHPRKHLLIHNYQLSLK